MPKRELLRLGAQGLRSIETALDAAASHLGAAGFHRFAWSADHSPASLGGLKEAGGPAPTRILSSTLGKPCTYRTPPAWASSRSGWPTPFSAPIVAPTSSAGTPPWAPSITPSCRGSLHRREACGVDLQQLRRRHLRREHQRDRRGLRRKQPDPQRPRAQEPVSGAVRATPQEPPPRSRRASTTCFSFVVMAPYAGLYLRCPQPGHDIIAKIICNHGVGHIMESDTHENHLINARGPVTLRYMRFKLTDVNGKTVNLRGTSISFCIYLDG